MRTMVVTVTVTENVEAKPWDLEKFIAKVDFPMLEVTSQDRDAAVEHAKGSALCAIGMFKRVPDKIEFKIIPGKARSDGPAVG